MTTRLKRAIGASAMVLTISACFVFTSKRKPDDQISLTFQRYSDMDPYVGDVAFLWLTNASTKSYLLTMPSNTFTLQFDFTFGHNKKSVLLSCEFSDRTPHGWTNWTQQPSPNFTSNSYVSLNPHSGMVVRVPLRADGQERKAAVLYRAQSSVPAFWTTAVGFRVLRMLPKSLRNRVTSPQSVWQKVWCDRELTNSPSQWIQTR
jgi:hypothetical protein